MSDEKPDKLKPGAHFGGTKKKCCCGHSPLATRSVNPPPGPNTGDIAKDVLALIKEAKEGLK